jgi:hypothetical protein
MSCDYSVWHTSTRLNAAQAGQLHLQLCEGDTSGVVPHPGIDAFYRELTAQHPEIDDVPEERIDDKDMCPWSAAFDRSEGHIIMCCIWPKADYVGDLVGRLAAKHGLAFYDPQSERIVYPGETRVAKPWWKFW